MFAQSFLQSLFLRFFPASDHSQMEDFHESFKAQELLPTFKSSSTQEVSSNPEPSLVPALSKSFSSSSKSLTTLKPSVSALLELFLTVRPFTTLERPPASECSQVPESSLSSEPLSAFEPLSGPKFYSTQNPDPALSQSSLVQTRKPITTQSSLFAFQGFGRISRDEAHIQSARCAAQQEDPNVIASREQLASQLKANQKTREQYHAKQRKQREQKRKRDKEIEQGQRSSITGKRFKALELGILSDTKASKIMNEVPGLTRQHGWKVV